MISLYCPPNIFLVATLRTGSAGFSRICFERTHLFITFLFKLGKHIFKKHPVIGAIAGSILGSAGIGCVRKTVFA